jgi:hypothetical protein
MSKLKEIAKRLGFLEYGKAHQNSVKTQAIIYLLQQMGIELGYEFELNVRGIYSRQLAEDMHKLYPKAMSYEMRASESAFAAFSQKSCCKKAESDLDMIPAGKRGTIRERMAKLDVLREEQQWSLGKAWQEGKANSAPEQCDCRECCGTFRETKPENPGEAVASPVPQTPRGVCGAKRKGGRR